MIQSCGFQCLISINFCIDYVLGESYKMNGSNHIIESLRPWQTPYNIGNIMLYPPTPNPSFNYIKGHLHYP